MKNVKYKVWSKIENKVTTYLVINIETKTIQSSWRTFKEARDTVSLLNKPSSKNLKVFDIQ